MAYQPSSLSGHIGHTGRNARFARFARLPLYGRASGRAGQDVP
jgi:hypothetical protein